MSEHGVSRISDQLAQTFERLQLNPRPQSEVDAWEWENWYVPQMRNAGLDARFRARIDGEGWNKQQLAVFNRTDALLQNSGAIVALVGIRGIGKTAIASQLILRRLEEWRGWFGAMPENREGMRKPRGLSTYRKMSKIVMDVKSLYADFGSVDTEKQMRERDALLSVSLLVIDELHDCDDQKLKNRILTDMLDIRYANRRDTVLISNQTRAEFEGTTSDSALSRLSEHGEILSCKWKSFREKP